MKTEFVLESVNDFKFPYRLTIRRGEKLLLALRVQDRWPGQKGNIFCIREDNITAHPPVEEIERIAIVSINRYGKRLAIVLDRAYNKRCDFLFLRKKYKNREGEYEQIFWRTQKALSERRPKTKISTYHNGQLNIVIDTGEKYAWRFPGSMVEKARLPVGDYGLKDKNSIIAVVERKTYENMLAEFGRLPAFHQQLGELATYKYAAVVIEANYSDFLNPAKLKFYKPTFAAKAIAEIYAFHPNLDLIFAGNRKLANEWVYRFFEAVAAHESEVPHEKISELIENYGEAPRSKGGAYFELTASIRNGNNSELTVKSLQEMFPHVAVSTVRKALANLEKEGVIKGSRKGKQKVWIKTS